MKFYYVYILQSINSPDRYYVGFTENLDERLKDHNSGKSSYTSKFKPWRFETYLAFSDKSKALNFEKYIKSGSGRAFSKKRL
jgi:predicted GIY-YIG superfamily endonuclease